ncbi:MAG: DUF1080 domain-containing protein [Opitutaceae bacterium]
MPLPIRSALAAVICLLASRAGAQVSPAPPATVSLFNGRNFDGLHVFVENPATDPPAAWKIEDGMLRCLGVGRGYVRTVHAYADYTLRFEFRWPKIAGNSGLMLHLVGPDLIWPKSIEAQVQTNRAGDFASFSDARSKEEIVSRNPRGVSTGRLPRPGPSTEKPLGEWNTYEIVAAGDTVTLFVNGTQVNRMTGVTPSGGMIGFQAEGTPIDFRNITLTPLPPAKDLNAPMPPALPAK